MCKNFIVLKKNKVLTELHFNLVPIDSYYATYFNEENVLRHLDKENHKFNEVYNFAFFLVH